jgi:hypothetical protein
MDSKIEYLKDQLSELNSDWSVFRPKCPKSTVTLENHYLNEINVNLPNKYRHDSSSDDFLSTDSVLAKTRKNFNENISPDIMIFLALKETVNKLNFDSGFSNFIKIHYREDPKNFCEQIKQFNYFREVITFLAELAKRIFLFFFKFSLQLNFPMIPK